MRFTLKKSLFLPFVVILSLFATAYLIFNGYNTFSQTFEGSRNIIQQQNKIQHAIADMYSASRDRIQTLLKMAATVDDFELDELRQQMRWQADTFLTARNKIFSLNLSAKKLERYYPIKLRKDISANADLQNIAADLFVEKNHAQALNVLLKYGTSEQMDLLSAIAQMNTMLDKEIEQTMMGLDQEFTKARLDFKILGSFVFIAFAIIMMTIIIRLLHGKHLLSGLLEDRNLQYKRIVDSVQDGIITMSKDGRISSFNRGAENIFGYSANTMSGANISQLINNCSQRLFKNYIMNIIDGKQASDLILIGSRFNGEKITLHIAFSNTSNTGLAAEQQLSGIIRDVTTQKKTEEEQIRKSKLESIGVLAGGIAHDFNNLLSGISGYLELAQKNLTNQEKTLYFLNASKTATERAAGLTQQLLTFAKGGEPVKHNANISDIIRQAADFNLHGSNITCHYEIAGDLWLVNINGDQISQVIHNLIINAKLAMQDKGKIRIGCHNTVDVVNEDIVIASGQYIKITIEDTGSGIPEEILDSIFDPYFTTRKQGSGLGLALSYSIITKHDGFIYVQSTVGRGSCFSIYLPASKDQVVAAQVTSLDNIAVDTTKRIMLMDDDEVIREVAESMLNDLGYEVVCVASGEEAISTYKSALLSKESIDLIIMDLTIVGGMGGKDAIKILRSLDANVKTIVSSGYSNDTVMANYKDYGFQDAMAKPYSFDTLRETIKNNL